MELIEVYNRVNNVLCALDFVALFAGFHRYPFAIYSHEEICLDGMLLPYADCFRGNTSILYRGEYIAIWNYEMDPVADMETLAYLMVHEMFHCHQLVKGEDRFPSDLALLNCPDDMANLAQKHHENLLLAECCERCDIGSLREFAALREQRMQRYPDTVRQELRTETVEGMAEFVGLCALRQINAAKFSALISRYIGLLRAPGALLFDARRLAYYTGALFLLCLEQLGLRIGNDFASGLTVYEQNRIDAAGARVEQRQFDFIEREYEALRKERAERIDRHISRSRYTDCAARICGYDPMNMFRYGDRIFCSHFVCLEEGGSTKAYFCPTVLVMDGDSDERVAGYYLGDADHV